MNTPPFCVAVALGLGTGCGAEPGSSTPPASEAAPVTVEPVSLGPTCATLSASSGWLGVDGDGAYAFSGPTADAAPPILLQPTALGRVLLYDGGEYVVAVGEAATQAAALQSDITTGEDHYVSAGEWLLFVEAETETYRLQARRDGTWLADDGRLVGAVEQAAAISIVESAGCAAFPELSLDATGAVTRTTFDDGTLFGVAESHAHLLSNFSFGGGGLFHGGAYHPYGVEHALPDCAFVHGREGRKDLFGYAYDQAGGDLNLMDVLTEVGAGELSEFNHATAGYPAFTEWPDSRNRATHQTQYHRWLERAWMGGLRLLVQHATSDETICKLTVGTGFQESRYDCSDMTAVDRIIDETWELQGYIDALHGGEGEGWFRVVRTPEEAREVIADGKLAVLLGIETSNLFRCYLTPGEGEPSCDEAYVDAQLDAYYDRGVRALFPVHKYGNRFSPGDGSNGFIEMGAFINSGHWSNKTEDCPPDEWSLPGMFDGRSLSVAGINQPRDAYLAEAPNDMSGFEDDPFGTVLPHASALFEGSLDGEWCQNASITPLGEHLLEGMMRRGMIIEVDHFPQWAYVDAYALLQDNDYPAAGTHGRDWQGQLYELGGVASLGFGRCQSADAPGQSTAAITRRVELIEEKGGYPGTVFSFDFNGFAGGPGPRFGDDGCGGAQPNELTYPFESYAGDVTFTEPAVGDRVIDFNTEGMVHLGLLPELLQDLRADAVSDAEIEPVYRGAEAYVRMWEKAEARAAAMSAR
jgi:microsomal dipeptidase-like Zn-dependent dipeptidase